jgi:ribonuclease HI
MNIFIFILPIKMNNVAYTDGSCSPNPGPGGWAYIYNQKTFNSGAELNTTNNRMELKAIIECLRYHESVNPGSTLTIHSDSQLTINCAQRLWKRNLNLDLWEVFDTFNTKIEWVKVKAHSGDKYNTMVDNLANDARIGGLA